MYHLSPNHPRYPPFSFPSCLMLVALDHCPALALDAFIRGCRNVVLGDMCEGDGGCGTDDTADNCFMMPQRRETSGDMYVRVPCEPDAMSELTWCATQPSSALSRTMPPQPGPNILECTHAFSNPRNPPFLYGDPFVLHVLLTGCSF